MATRSVIAFLNNGAIEGTYVHYDGYPENIIPALQVRLKEEGYESLKNWIEKGIQGGGYPSIDDEPYGDVGEEWRQPIDAQEYGYLVAEDGVELLYSVHDGYNEARERKARVAELLAP